MPHPSKFCILFCCQTKAATPEGGGGGTPIVSYKRRLGPFLRFKKILNFNILGGFQKNEHFWGYEDFVDIFWGHHKTGPVLQVISMHFRGFHKVIAQNGDIF